MQFHFLTIFPDIFDSYLAKGMLRIALAKKIIKIKTHNLRDFSIDRRGTVDDRPYGGGPGQIMMAEPIIKALKKLKAGPFYQPKIKSKVILLSAAGKKWNQQLAQRFAKNCDRLIFICPRYEGCDARIEKFADEKISIGDYVLTGGELPAMVIVDSITRLLPGVLGEPLSLAEESHSAHGYLEYPQYTRPEKLDVGNGKLGKKRIMKVPKVLLSGHHGKIKLWREKHSKKTT